MIELDANVLATLESGVTLAKTIEKTASTCIVTHVDSPAQSWPNSAASAVRCSRTSRPSDRDSAASPYSVPETSG